MTAAGHVLLVFVDRSMRLWGPRSPCQVETWQSATSGQKGGKTEASKKDFGCKQWSQKKEQEARNRVAFRKARRNNNIICQGVFLLISAAFGRLRLPRANLKFFAATRKAEHDVMYVAEPYFLRMELYKAQTLNPKT